jgi:polysaccharide deacetylase 2 family uncharacterized protein YibQ
MGGGIILGVFWGVLASLAVAAIVSLNTPLPPRPETVEVAVEEAPAAEAEAAPPAPEEAAAPEAPAQAEDTEAPAPADDAAVPADGEEPATRPSGPADTIPLPAGSEFNRPPPEEEAQVPGVDAPPGVVAPGAPPLPLQTTGGGIDTAPAPQPEVSAALSAPQAPVALTGDATAPALGNAASVPGGRPAPAPPPVPAPEPDAAAAPDAETAPKPEETAEATVAEEGGAVSGSTGTVANAETDAETDGGSRPEPSASDAAPEVPVAEAPAAMSEVPAAIAEAPAVETAASALQPAPPASVVQLVPAREGGALGVATPEAPPTELAQAEAPAMAPAPRILRPGAPEAGARTLPQIVAPGRTELPATPEETTAEAAPEAPAADEDVPALVAHAAPFDAAETRPLIAVVLIDEPDARLDISALTDFTFPVAFAIDPTRPDAAERAAAYRAAGFEVLMLGSVIPEGATATDTEVALAAARRNLPEAVALLDTPESRIQSDRAVLEAAVGAVAREGQGLVAFPRGMNTAEQMAARVDVPAATIFRLLDDEDQRATLITRFLARAEFAAVQEGAVIVAGRTRPDTVTALYSWALGDRNEGVAIAPVSAVLLRLAEE